MPDLSLIVMAMLVALTVSALLMGMVDWFRRPGWTSLTDAGYVLSIGLGFFLGCWVLGVQPHWRPREDLDRLLLVVLPVVVVAELVVVAAGQAPGWLVWPLRLALLAGAARVLLHGTSYIADLTGPGTSEWSSSFAWLVFAGLAALEGAIWALFLRLARQASDWSLSICLAVISAGAALTIMLSGYATGGQVGLPLAAALVGTTMAAPFLKGAKPGIGPHGVPLVLLFSLLVIGRFFGALSLLHATILLCAPLLGWVPELPYLRHLPSWTRGLARIALIVTVVLIVVIRAQAKFKQDFQSPLE